jgi:hypothetical protein
VHVLLSFISFSFFPRVIAEIFLQLPYNCHHQLKNTDRHSLYPTYHFSPALEVDKPAFAVCSGFSLPCDKAERRLRKAVAPREWYQYCNEIILHLPHYQSSRYRRQECIGLALQQRFLPGQLNSAILAWKRVRNVVHIERSCWFGYSNWFDSSSCVQQVSNINHIYCFSIRFVTAVKLLDIIHRTVFY